MYGNQKLKVSNRQNCFFQCRGMPRVKSFMEPAKSVRPGKQDAGGCLPNTIKIFMKRKFDVETGNRLKHNTVGHRP